MHKEEEAVKKAMTTINIKDRKHQFRQIMTQGIEKYNDDVIGSQQTLMRIKRAVKQSSPYKCSNCRMIYSGASISRHKLTCNSGRGRGSTKLGQKTFAKYDTSFLEPDFFEVVYDKMRE